MKKHFWAALCALTLFFSLGGALAAPSSSITVDIQDAGTGTYTPTSVLTVPLTLNSVVLEGDIPTYRASGRTLISVRLIAEALGANVLWVQETSQAIIQRGGDTIVLTLGSSAALFNGKTIQLPDGVPATKVKYGDAGRTMVPLRFVSESLGAEVVWDAETNSADIIAVVPTPTPLPSPTIIPSPSPNPVPSPSPTVTPTHTNVTGITTDPSMQTILISTNYKPTFVVTDMADRVVIDLTGASLAANAITSASMDSSYIASIRCAQHDGTLYPAYPSTVRVVLDLHEDRSLADNITITAQDKGLLISAHQTGGGIPPTTPPSPPPTVGQPLDPSKITIVLDAGHGGSTIGASYEGIYEQDINLAVTKKLQAVLTGWGYHIIMTRTEDVNIGLYERAAVANNANAALFVSLHSNAAKNSPNYTGIYTYHYPGATEAIALGKAIQKAVISRTGAIDRGINADNLVVVREPKMTAVLVEMGFMTNHGELMNLLDASYQDKLALGIGEGIVNYLRTLYPDGPVG